MAVGLRAGLVADEVGDHVAGGVDGLTRGRWDSRWRAAVKSVPAVTIAGSRQPPGLVWASRGPGAWRMHHVSLQIAYRAAGMTPAVPQEQ